MCIVTPCPDSCAFVALDTRAEPHGLPWRPLKFDVLQSLALFAGVVGCVAFAGGVVGGVVCGVNAGAVRWFCRSFWRCVRKRRPTVARIFEPFAGRF